MLIQSKEVFYHDFLKKHFLPLELSVYLIMRVSQVTRIRNNSRFIDSRTLLNFNLIAKMMKKK